MTDPEQDLATILAALKSAEPSPGLDRRILENLAAHPAAAAPRPARRWPSLPALTHRPQPLRAPVPFALAAALVLALSLAFLYQHHQAATTHPSGTIPLILSNAPVSPDLTPDKLCCHASPELAGRKSPPHLASSRRASPRTPTPHAAVAPSRQLASFPAPPLPLTPQEKLLLRVAHARNPQQSPILDPALRASLAARDSEDFQLFFAAATTIPPEDQPPH